MLLSKEAKKELREILEKEIGKEKTKNFSDAEINEVGILLLNIFAENIKIHIINSELSTNKFCK